MERKIKNSSGKVVGKIKVRKNIKTRPTKRIKFLFKEKEEDYTQWILLVAIIITLCMGLIIECGLFTIALVIDKKFGGK